MSANEGNMRYIEELERNGELNSEQAQLQRQKYNQENNLPDFRPYELNHQENRFPEFRPYEINHQQNIPQNQNNIQNDYEYAKALQEAEDNNSNNQNPPNASDINRQNSFPQPNINHNPVYQPIIPAPQLFTQPQQHHNSYQIPINQPNIINNPQQNDSYHPYYPDQEINENSNKI